MCVRNINSYGCGCEYKEVTPCGRNCEPEVGYRFIREYDCKNCKAGGQAVTRGRDGHGRYAQAITRRENKEELQSVTGPVVDDAGSVSPWSKSPVEMPEKSWHKGRRRHADRAWEEEHESRMDDICSRAESMSLRSDSTPRPTSSRTQYRRSPSPVEIYSSTDEDRHSHRSKSSRKPLYGEVMSFADIGARSPRRHRDYPRSHYESQDSLDSIPKVTPGTRSRKLEYDPYDSGYGSHGSRRSHGSPRSHYGARTESYSYSTSPQRHHYQTPVSGQQYGYPVGYYGVERTPVQRYMTY